MIPNCINQFNNDNYYYLHNYIYYSLTVTIDANQSKIQIAGRGLLCLSVGTSCFIRVSNIH